MDDGWLVCDVIMIEGRIIVCIISGMKGTLVRRTVFCSRTMHYPCGRDWVTFIDDQRVSTQYTCSTGTVVVIEVNDIWTGTGSLELLKFPDMSVTILSATDNSGVVSSTGTIANVATLRPDGMFVHAVHPCNTGLTGAREKDSIH